MQLHGFKYLAKLLMSFLLGKSQVLVPNTVEINGGNNLITNAVVVARNTNHVYYTASSTKFDLTDAMYEALTKGSGRLYKYDMNTNTSTGKYWPDFIRKCQHLTLPQSRLLL